MKRLNHGLALIITLMLCTTGFRFGMIANAEEPGGADDPEINLEKEADEDLTEESGKVFIKDGILTEGISETQEEPETTGDADPTETPKALGTPENPAEADPTESQEPATDEDVETIEDTDAADEAAIDPTEDEVDELADDETEKKVVEKDIKKISIDVTFKVVNGAWDDGTTEDKTVTLTGEEGEKLWLTVEMIPAVGNMPADETYKSGSWDKTPNVDEPLTEATTYTYTYSQKQKAVVVIAPEAKTLYVISE